MSIWELIMGVNMTRDIKWDKIFYWEYIDNHCCIAAFASGYCGKTNIIIINLNLKLSVPFPLSPCPLQKSNSSYMVRFCWNLKRYILYVHQSEIVLKFRIWRPLPATAPSKKWNFYLWYDFVQIWRTIVSISIAHWTKKALWRTSELYHK